MNNILSFEEFTDRIQRDVKAFLPLDYSSAEVKVNEMQKLNSDYLGMTVTKEGQTIAPTINLNELYSVYERTGEITPIFQKIAEITTMTPDNMEVHKLEDYSQAKESLFIRVSNAETNKELLGKVPHEINGDLAITYHIMMGRDDSGYGSTMVNNELMEKWGISEAQMKADAMENSSKILSPSLESMNNVMARMMGMQMLQTEQVPFERAVEDFNFRDEGMFVLTNTSAVNGAAVIFYPEVMEQLGAHAQSDMFIIPSSVHEVIIVPDDGVMSRPQLESMIRDINASEVDPKDRLSDSLYHYDSKENKLERAVDFEERKEREQSIGITAEKTSIKDKLKSAEARVNEQTTVARPGKQQAIE